MLATVVQNWLCLLVVVAVHEYGHLHYARRAGVVPLELAVGFGPKLFGYTNNSTLYTLRLIPLGGYVLLPVGATYPSTWAEIKMVLGGPLANLWLCMVLSVVMVANGNVPNQLAEIPFWWLVVLAPLVTIGLYVAAVPFTVYVLGLVVLQPIGMLEATSGPIGMLAGNALPVDIRTHLSAVQQMLITMWIFSLGVGTFSLLPLSVLNGGRVFAIALARYKRFMYHWSAGTGAMLFVFVVYIFVGDIVKFWR